MKKIMILVMAVVLSAGTINATYAQDPKCKKECCKNCDPKCEKKCSKDECNKNCCETKPCHKETAKV